MGALPERSRGSWGRGRNLTPVCSPKFRLLSPRTRMPHSAPDHNSSRVGKGRSSGRLVLMGFEKHHFEKQREARKMGDSV